MITLRLYDKTKIYFMPNMKALTPEQAALDFSILNYDIDCVIETDPSEIMFYTSPRPLTIFAQELGLNPEDFQSTSDLINAMENILNAPLPEPQPSAEERIASQLELQNMLAMPDVY